MIEVSKTETYFREVSEETARYARDLIRENRQLRALVTSLEADSKRLRATIEQDFVTYKSERSELEARVAEMERASQKYLEDYLDVEQQNTNLANLYVATYRLHSTLVRTEVLSGIEEIVVNLIGSEELAIIEIDEETREPRLALSFGLDAHSFDDLPDSAQRRIEDCFATGQIWVRSGADAGDRLTACIPLAVDGRPTGAIVIFRLLQQKPVIEPVDHELFGLLAAHAATALYCTSLHAGRQQPVLT